MNERIDAATPELRALADEDPGDPSAPVEALPEPVAYAFAPIHKRAFGIAVGTAAALLVGGVTLFHVVARPPDAGYLRLLANYFYGYTVSWAGILVGMFWAFATGFVAGWFVAFSRNLVIAASVFITRTREELRQTRDFLDHI